MILCVESLQALVLMKWLLPGLGLWHLRFNLLRLIHKIHWGRSSPVDQSTLQFAADRWDRSRVVQPDNFQALEDLIVHSYHARITGLLQQVMQRDRTVDMRYSEEHTDWLASHTPSAWKHRLMELYQKVHLDPILAPKESLLDDHWLNHTRYCNHVETYLLLSYAIKNADIGLLRRALRECCIMFQSKVGGTTNYGRELIRQIHLVDSSAASEELQRAVLVNSLVNLHSEGVNEATNFETDRLLELLNNTLKYFRRELESSTQESSALLEQCALNGPYFQQLKLAMETNFSHRSSGDHPTKDASEDILSMAKELARQSLPMTPQIRFTGYDAVDLFENGLESLGENVETYNAEVRSGWSWTSDDQETDLLTDTLEIPDSPTLSIPILT
jgi:hypothetical protein